MYRLYIFGEVSYVDIFGQNNRTRFCSSVVGGENVARLVWGEDISDGGIHFEPAPVHNEAT